MSYSTILQIPEIAENQNNKYISHNNAISYLEQAAHAKLSKTTSGTTAITLTATECVRYRHYHIGAGTESGTFNLVFLGEIDGGGLVNAQREFVVSNQSTKSVVVKSDAAGTTVTLTAGQKALIRQDHDDMSIIMRYEGSTLPYDVGCSITGKPDDNVEVMKFMAVRAIDFPDDFAGSYGHCGTNPTSTATFTIKKNGSSIGSISINTSGVFTFVTTGTTTSLSAGDRISVQTPTPQDATLADVSWTFLGTRTP